MIMNFATSEKHRAKQFLESDSYAWLNQEAKDFVLDNLSEDIANGFRVQDPAMYPKPQLMTGSKEMHSRLLDVYKKPISKEPTNDKPE